MADVRERVVAGERVRAAHDRARMHSSTSGGRNTNQMSCRPRPVGSCAVITLSSSSWTWRSVTHGPHAAGEAHCFFLAGYGSVSSIESAAARVVRAGSDPGPVGSPYCVRIENRFVVLPESCAASVKNCSISFW